jgi:hypothetical protein
LINLLFLFLSISISIVTIPRDLSTTEIVKIIFEIFSFIFLCIWPCIKILVSFATIYSATGCKERWARNKFQGWLCTLDIVNESQLKKEFFSWMWTVTRLNKYLSKTKHYRACRFASRNSFAINNNPVQFIRHTINQTQAIYKLLSL